MKRINGHWTSRLPAFGSVLLSSSILFGAGAATAQVVASPDEAALARTGLFARDQNVSVLERGRPDYAPLGINLDSFKIAPELDAGLEYNSNIYATPNDVISDEIAHISPSVSATSDWNRNQLQFIARGAFNEYFDHSTEDTNNGAVGVNGRLDIYDNMGATAGATFEHDTESRTSPNSPFTAKSPIQYDLASAWLGAAAQFTHVRLSARYDLQNYTYENGDSVDGGRLYEKDRDYTISTGTFRAEYAALPGTSVFANLVINQQENSNLLTTDITRSNDGYEMTVGSNFDLNHLVRGEVFIGYLDQTFDSHVYKEVSGISLRGYVQYFPTQLLTLTLSGTRVPMVSVIFNTGAYFDSNVTLRADYEVLRNLLITGTVGYENDAYSGISRQDDRNFETLSATYLLNRRVGLSLTFQHAQNDSSGEFQGFSFDIESLTAGVTLRY